MKVKVFDLNKFTEAKYKESQIVKLGGKRGVIEEGAFFEVSEKDIIKKRIRKSKP